MPPEIASTSQDVAANNRTVASTIDGVAIESPPALVVEGFLKKIDAQLREAPAAIAPNQTIKIELRAHEVGHCPDPMEEATTTPTEAADKLLSKLPSLPPEPGDDELPPIDPDGLLAEVNRQVESMPRRKDGSVQFTVQANELRYLRKSIRNAKIDEWRWIQRYYKRFDSLDQCEEANRRAEARDEKLPHRDAQAPVTDDASIELELAEEHAASRRKVYELLRGLPLQLAVIAYALPRVRGNISELARQLGQPQRRTARQVARLQELLRQRGFGA
ncbi:MAG TPA: hypothetical protein VNK24_05530 [Elusimicrobiota bacterium]|nr:hypothetical protein [Elusimicrobiota bacterium]